MENILNDNFRKTCNLSIDIISFIISHNSETGLCAKAKLENSEVVWTKTECGDTSTKGVVCSRRFNWEDIGIIYAV